MSLFTELAEARYVSLATFRKSGTPVATPVWVAPLDDALWVFSEAAAGKVKRLTNSNQAQLATCTFNGTLTGEWCDATAVLIDDPDEIKRALKALREKYGWQMWLADTGARLTGRYQRRAYIKIELSVVGQPGLALSLLARLYCTLNDIVVLLARPAHRKESI